MRCKNKIITVLCSKSGASLLFVIGIMLFLLSIGGSVIAAASTNYGSNLRQNQYNAAVVLNDSIQRNIRFSLQTSPGTLPVPAQAFTKSLASNLPLAMYAAEAANNPLTLFEMEIGGVAGLPSGPDKNYTITVKFPFHPEVNITAPVDAMPELAPPDTPGSPFNFRTPRAARINTRMVVEVSVFIGVGDNARIHTTQAVYEYRDGVLTDDGIWNDEILPPGIPGTMSFSRDPANPNDTAEAGQWLMVSYEIFE